jgi:flavodoxin
MRIKNMNLKEEKSLVAYYSRKGNNYVDGSIENLPIGNTEVVAAMIQEMIECDVFKIDTVNSYPEDYTETTNVAKNEQNNNARPELKSHIENMDFYDVILLGYPNWYGTMPMALFTFLEEYDFSQKKIIPFCTHEGSGLGRSENDIAKLCPEATVLKGLDITGSQVNESKNTVKNWLDEI